MDLIKEAEEMLEFQKNNQGGYYLNEYDNSDLDEGLIMYTINFTKISKIIIDVENDETYYEFDDDWADEYFETFEEALARLRELCGYVEYDKEQDEYFGFNRTEEEFETIKERINRREED